MGLRPHRSLHILLVSVLGISMLGAVSSHFVFAQSTSEQKLAEERLLQRELEKVLAEIEAQKAVLQNQRNQSATIERDVNILDAQIREAQLELEANGIRILQLSEDISIKSNTISELEDKTIREKESLAFLLRRMREIDDYSTIEIFLTNQNLSDFFEEADSLRSLKVSLRQDLAQIAEYQRITTEQKVALEMARNQQEIVNNEIANEKKKVEVSQNQKEVLLSASRDQEKTYEQIVAEREARAAQIRSALFSLRDSTDINFGQALDLARIAEKGTGVRPAFLLAIITQESNLGQNVGRCNLPSTPDRTWREIMKPDRDHAPYLAVVHSLGLDPDTQPLSCPIGTVGWGGAMGPAQFIPSTWAMYTNRVTSVTGSNPANPWSPRDAFAASSLFLADLGASRRTYDAEWEAAARYYAGGGWQTRGVQYANSVLNIAAGIQSQIDTLESF
ncbi:MAG: hypothetical protein WDZ75_01395 [Candidatus Paceibacterota bacterium]